MTEIPHLALLAGYAAALAGWWGIHRLIRPGLWPAGEAVSFERPWAEFGLAVLAAALTPLVGQFWVRGLLLPEEGAFGPLLASVNQIAIFAPVLAFIGLRGLDRNGVWLGGNRIGERLGAGAVLAMLALLAWSLVRADDHGFLTSLLRVPRYGNLDVPVQVLLEDVTIALLFVRLCAAAGHRVAIGAVALLFAAGHVPTLLATGAPLAELVALLGDAGLAALVLSVLWRSRDITWFWLVHTMLDMTQFTRVTGV
ncbi:MAG: hypothetical protein RQ751_05475 [Longimicrobiales bacterium]|nr:hypothetical protein [Longimicrobiales bacterium]